MKTKSQLLMIQALASLLLLDFGPLRADEDQSSRRTVVDEIRVTAQRREQSLQQVPISVTAFSEEAIELNQIDGLQDYFKLTPNVSFSNNGNRGRNQLAIRGVGNIGGRANAFGIYIDGFNIAPTSSIRTFDPNLIDVERIEILRGPQGTFFGRNATAGAINIVSKKPSSEFSAEVEAEFGRYDSTLFRGSANVPLVEDRLAALISAYDERTDGFIDNTGPAGRGSDLDSYGARLALRYTPTDRLTVDFGFRYNDYDHGTNAYVIRDPVTLGVPDEPFTIDTDREEFAKIETEIYTASVAYDFGGFTFTSITGYIDNLYREFDDRDNSPADLQFQDAVNDLQSLSQEFKFDVNFSDKVELIAGAIYAEDEQAADVVRAFGADAGGGNILDFNTVEESTTWAIFSDAVLHILPKFDLTLGGRFTDTDYERIDRNVLFGNPLFTNLGQSQADTDFSPRFVLTYNWSETARGYFSVAKGFKMGAASGSVPPGASPIFDKETVWNYEVGIKGQFLDQRLLLNAAAFYMDWSDLQVFAFEDPNSVLFFVQNAAEASTEGAELEIAALPIDNLQLTFGAGYLDATFDSFPNARVDGMVTDLSGFRVPFAPEWTLNATGHYTFPISDQSDVFLRFEWSYVDDTFRNPDAHRNFVVNGDRTFFIPSYSVTNFRIGYETARFRIVGFVENVFEEEYFTGVRGNTLVDPHPRMYGLRLTYAHN